MESRAATIGARLDIVAGPQGRGTAIVLDVPSSNGG
jgi:signal transduction histidine kinase